ncbi:hypothetical protein B0H34DRAFT_826095, partial [Crassisporium funariophilum]
LAGDVDLDDEHSSESDKPEELVLNPSAEVKPIHYLIDNGKRLYKPTVVARMLQSETSARKTTHRPSRAQGVALENLVKRQFQNRNHAEGESASDDTNKLKAGDLGAILTKTGDQICLTVAEILNFRQGTLKTNLSSIDIDDLDAVGSKSMTVATQILKLSPKTIQVDSGNEVLIWQWTKEYIQTQKSKDETLTQRNFAVRVPGSIFLPLGPMIVDDDDGNPTWGLTDSDLKEALDDAWASLDPEGDNILANIKLLPDVTGDGVPYHLGDPGSAPHFVVPNLSAIVNLVERKGDTEIPCHLCGSQQFLKNMRNHVGKHLLLSLRDMGDTDKNLNPDIEIGVNSCGWCGLDESCKTNLIRKQNRDNSDSFTLQSNCQYFYSKMNYASACKSTRSTPCTNVPLHCPLCPTGVNGQPSTFWKYILIYHMHTYHVSDHDDLPPFPVELRVVSHISKAEEKLLGVSLEKTKNWRDRHKMADSDGITAFQDEIQRKRAASNVSKSSASSTGSRQPSPSKVQRMNYGYGGNRA